MLVAAAEDQQRWRVERGRMSAFDFARSLRKRREGQRKGKGGAPRPLWAFEDDCECGVSPGLRPWLPVATNDAIEETEVLDEDDDDEARGFGGCALALALESATAETNAFLRSRLRRLKRQLAGAGKEQEEERAGFSGGGTADGVPPGLRMGHRHRAPTAAAAPLLSSRTKAEQPPKNRADSTAADEHLRAAAVGGAHGRPGVPRRGGLRRRLDGGRAGLLRRCRCVPGHRGQGEAVLPQRLGGSDGDSISSGTTTCRRKCRRWSIFVTEQQQRRRRRRRRRQAAEVGREGARRSTLGCWPASTK